MKLVNVEILPAQLAHARAIASRMRPESAIEVERLGANLVDSLEETIRKSRYSWVGMADGEVACLFGIVTPSMISDVGGLWLVTTPLVEKYPLVFVRYSKIFIDDLLKAEFRTISGAVRTDFTRSVRWLKWLGFKLGEDHNGLRTFTRRAE